ncbi:hypothetical protein [Mycoplasmopsis felifaucium]|uniref:DUF4064 domain-containing protein n=1 Tax=Mycoplasmopsis felifaucium TaxID=35768 RepID=A0ABZ2RSA5_9BACT
MSKIKKLAIANIVLPVLVIVLAIVLMVISAGAVAVASSATSSGDWSDAVTTTAVGVSSAVIAVWFLLSFVGIAQFIIQIIMTILASKQENKTIMILLIIGFFVPLLTLIASIMILANKKM